MEFFSYVKVLRVAGNSSDVRGKVGKGGGKSNAGRVASALQVHFTGCGLPLMVNHVTLDKSLNLRLQVPYLSAKAKNCPIWELPSKSNIPGLSVPLPTPEPAQSGLTSRLQALAPPRGCQESAFGWEWEWGKQWQNESPWRILGKKRPVDCPPWLHP